MKAKYISFLFAMLLPISCLGELSSVEPLAKECRDTGVEKYLLCRICDSDPNNDGNNDDSTCHQNHESWDSDIENQQDFCYGSCKEPGECCAVYSWEFNDHEKPTWHAAKETTCAYTGSGGEECKITLPKSTAFYKVQDISDVPDVGVQATCRDSDGNDVEAPGKQVYVSEIDATCKCEDK